jgi:8-oxo-dGTP diphosphatase
MSKNNNENNIILENIISIFTIEKGTLKVLLQRKKTEPYKGYWRLPGNILNNAITIEQNIDEILDETIGTSNIYKEQVYTFSNIDRYPSERIIATTYVALTDNKTIEIKKEDAQIEDTDWFDINALPKIAFDHKEIMDKAREELKSKLTNTTILKKLFPSDFTLPELQNTFESIMNIKLDRRNFRKKFITLGIIEETGYNNIGGSGRPAKLYRFKENIKETNLF